MLSRKLGSTRLKILCCCCARYCTRTYMWLGSRPVRLFPGATRAHPQLKCPVKLSCARKWTKLAIYSPKIAENILPFCQVSSLSGHVYASPLGWWRLHRGAIFWGEYSVYNWPHFNTWTHVSGIPHWRQSPDRSGQLCPNVQDVDWPAHRYRSPRWEDFLTLFLSSIINYTVLLIKMLIKFILQIFHCRRYS